MQHTSNIIVTCNCHDSNGLQGLTKLMPISNRKATNQSQNTRAHTKPTALHMYMTKAELAQRYSYRLYIAIAIYSKAINSYIYSCNITHTHTYIELQAFTTIRRAYNQHTLH